MIPCKKSKSYISREGPEPTSLDTENVSKAARWHKRPIVCAHTCTHTMIMAYEQSFPDH